MSPQFMVDLHKNLDKVNSIKLEDPPTPSKISKIDKLRSKDLKIFGGLGVSLLNGSLRFKYAW